MSADDSPPEFGHRIVVWGATGAGKTTFTRSLGGRLNIKVVELDAIRHAHGWDSTDWPEFRERLIEALDASADGWVTDGSYSRISDVYLSRADTLVWLHLPWRVSFWRLLKRTTRRARTGERLYHETGPRESWRLSFLSNRSILWWSISHHRVHVRTTRERIAGLPASIRVFVLRTPSEVEAFLTAAATTHTRISS